MGAERATSLRWRSAFSYELVHAAVHRQSGVDVAARVHADAVDMAALHAGEHFSPRIADADVRGFVAVFLLGNGERAVLAARDVVRPAHAGPHAEEVAVGGKNLDALVRPVGDVELAVRIDRDAVRQVEFSWCLARRAP